MIGAVVVVLVVLVVGYVTRGTWLPQLDASIAGLPSVDRLRAQVDEVDGKVEKLSREQSELGGGLGSLRNTIAARGEEHGAALTALRGSAGALDGQIQGVTARVAAVEQLIEAVRQAEAATSASMDDPTVALAERIRRIETQAALLTQIGKQDERLAEQEAQLAAIATRFGELKVMSSEVERLEALESAITALQSRAASAQESAVKAAAVVAAVGELREKLTTTAPFAAELARFRETAPAAADLAEALAAVDPYATAGIPTFAQLYRQLPGIAEGVIQASLRVEGDDWAATAVNDLMSLLTIRKTAQGNGVDAFLTDAQTAMAQGDLASAVAAMERIEGTQTDGSRAWIDGAKARLAAERLLARLQLVAVSLGAAQGG